jgi:hypothetical protein
MGRVVDDVTKEPLADAAVLARVAGAVVDQVRTNRDGVFVFPAVPAGDVSLGAVLPGYLGSGSAGRPVVLRVQAGQHVVDAVVPLRRFLAIGGTVRDETGEPVVDIEVGVHVQAQRGEWAAIQTTRTDDRGMYRFGQLSAGNYRVVVSPTAASVPHAAGGRSPMMYPATFAPSARTPAEAVIVALKPGADLSAVDVALRPVGEMRITGRLTGLSGPPAAPILLRLSPVDSGGLTTPFDSGRTTADAGGRFEFTRVPSGQYRLWMYQPPRRLAAPGTVEISTSSETLAVRSGAAATVIPAPSTSPLSADIALSVSDKDILDLEVPVVTGFAVSGRAVFDGGPTKPADVPLLLQRIDATRPGGEGRVNADGSLRLPDMVPGRYLIVPRTGAGPWQLRSVEYRGVNVADTGIDVREPISNLVLTFTDRQPSVTGTVHDDKGASVAAASVVIFPADRKLWNIAPLSWRMKLARTTQAGEFAIRNLPAGDYLCAALTDDAAVNWNDVDRLGELAPRAVKITLSEGQPAQIELPLLSAIRFDEPADTFSEHGPFVGDDPAPTQTKSSRVSISGVVREQSVAKAPLRGVTVELEGGDAKRAPAYSDADGRFTFSDLAPGPYRLRFTKPAFLAAEYGAKRIGGPGTAVVVAGADVVVEAALARGAVISGRVTDQRGRPLNGTKIALIGVRDAAGQPQLFSTTAAMPKELITDDRGEYRIYGLAPGTYFIAATPGNSGGAFSGRRTTDADIARAKDNTASAELRNAPAESFAPTFFPSAREFASAQPITVAAADERLGVDVTMGFSPVAKLRGAIVTSSGRPAAGAQLAVFPVGPYVPDADVILTSVATGEATSAGGSVRAAVGAAGTFAISGLTPGRYTVFARAAGGAGAASEFALTTVTVGDTDPPQLSLSLKPAPHISGTVALGTGQTGDVSAVLVALAPVDAGPLSVSVPATAVAADGKFSLPGALPGRYWLNVTGVPEGVGIVNADGAPSVSPGVPVVVSDGDEAVELNVTLGRSASVVGTFSDTTGVPATDYLVVLFDADKSEWLLGSPRLQAARPRTNGEFVFADVPPGDYRLAAVTDIAPDEWRSPSLLSRLVDASVAIVVKAGQRTTQNLQIAK